MPKVNIKCLKRILESIVDVYKHFVPSPVLVTVMHYQHPDGYEIVGKEGRYWIYVRIYGKYTYDLSLPKLIHYLSISHNPRYKKIMEELSSCWVTE